MWYDDNRDLDRGFFDFTAEELETSHRSTMRKVFDFLGVSPQPPDRDNTARVCPLDFAGGHIHHDPQNGVLVNAGGCSESDALKLRVRHADTSSTAKKSWS